MQVESGVDAVGGSELQERDRRIEVPVVHEDGGLGIEQIGALACDSERRIDMDEGLLAALRLFP